MTRESRTDLSPPFRTKGTVRAGACLFVFAFLAPLLLSALPEPPPPIPPSPPAPRAIPFWPNEVPAAIRAEIDGNAALETVRQIGRFHRVHGSPGYAAAASMMREKLLAAGLADAAVERLPADGKTRYAHFVSYPGWNPVSATLEEVTGPGRAIAVTSFPETPVALADYSRDADVTAALIDVGAGARAQDYDGRDVRGRIVLADGPLPLVHRLACEERGAAGIVSDFPNQTTAWSGDDRDLVRWGHLSPYQAANRFAFMVSRRQAEAWRARLREETGAGVTLHARVEARVVPASYDVVVATIPGTDTASGEVVLTAHLCHQSAGANDNASGSAAIFEAARALSAGIRRGTLGRPRRTIRFLWLPEIAGSQAYLVTHPDVARRIVAGIHMDMVGGLLSTTHGTFHLSRSAETLPHVVNVIARAWLDHVVAASSRYAERGGDSREGLVWLPGSRDVFLGDERGLEMGSDHEVFQDAAFAIPMVYFHDWPDVTIHTNKDLPENLDATKLGRVAYMGAGIAWTLAALPQSEAGALLLLAESETDSRAALAGGRGGDPRDRALRVREARDSGTRTLRTLADLWPVSLRARAYADESPLAAVGGSGILSPPAGRDDARVPRRNAAIRGPLDVYYWSFLPADSVASALERREGGDVIAFEAFNLADGKRSVREIRDVLTGRYHPVPLEEVSGYFDRLADAKAVTWGSPGGGGRPGSRPGTAEDRRLARD